MGKVKEMDGIESVAAIKPGESRTDGGVVVGLDVGHSAVKISWSNGAKVEKIIFPSAVTPAIDISDQDTAARAAAETILAEGKKYFFGNTAMVQGGSAIASGLVANWINTTEYKVLLCAAADRLQRSGANFNKAMIVCGLPSSLVQAQSDVLRGLMGVIFPTAEIKIQPQPMGAYAYYRLTEKGLPSKNIGEGEAWAVIDIGRFSADFLLVTGGNVVERVSHSSAGTRLVAEKLKQILKTRHEIDDLSPLEAEEVITSGHVLMFGKKKQVGAEIAEAIEQASSELLDTAGRLLGQESRRLAGVLVAGGGAQLFYQSIRKVFPHAIECVDARFAVAEGFRRIGAGIAFARRFKG